MSKKKGGSMLTSNIWQAALALSLGYQESGCSRLKEQLTVVLKQIELHEPINQELRALLHKSL
jgi:hypothetical protein